VKEGRCIILPRKVGDTVWRIKWTFETYPDKSEPYIEPDTFLLQDVFISAKLYSSQERKQTTS